MLRVVLIILLLAAGVSVWETWAPVRAAENMVFADKKSFLQRQAQTMTASLGGNLVLTETEAEDVLSALGTEGLSQIFVTDTEGNVVYTSAVSVAPLESCLLYPEVVAALHGNDSFRSELTDDAFVSFCAMPVMTGGTIAGCVFLADIDYDQASVLRDLSSSTRRTTAIVIMAAAAVFAVSAVMILRKNQRLLSLIYEVEEGNYNADFQVKGHNEYSAITQAFSNLTGRLRETETRRRQFVSDASHELRTPLAAIRLLSDTMLQNEMDSETQREFIGDILSEADRLTRMTTKLLTLTAIDSKKSTETEWEPVNISACCQKAVRILGPLAQENGITLEENSEEDCLVLALEDDIFQIILNLSENGIKYTPRGGTVRLIAYTQGETVVIIVEDSGIGIPEEECEQIFERFYRVDKARSREAGGTGLGLAIVRETAERFGGTVTAGNRAQGGARFTVNFPAYAEAETL